MVERICLNILKTKPYHGITSRTQHLDQKKKFRSLTNMSRSSHYCNDPMFSDTCVRAVSADSDQTAPLIRLLLEEQSDQGLHCLLFHLHRFDEIPKGLASFLEF